MSQTCRSPRLTRGGTRIRLPPIFLATSKGADGVATAADMVCGGGEVSSLIEFGAREGGDRPGRAEFRRS